MDLLFELLARARPHTIDLAALSASVIAAYYAIRAYRLKEGLYIRGSLTPSSSIASTSHFIRHVTLENLKDRAAIIFGVYVELGRGQLLEIEDFSDNPLVLKPFEVWHRDFDPADAYLVSSRRVRLPDLIHPSRVRLRLVLSTSQGRYTVREWVRRWYPVADWFRNHTSLLIKPFRIVVDGRGYGDNALYLVRTRRPSGERVDVALYPRDHELQRFDSFRLTKESLESRDALEAYLRATVPWAPGEEQTLEVLDLAAYRARALRDFGEDPIALPQVGWFTHHVLGPIATRYRFWVERRENARRYLAQKRVTAQKPQDGPESA